MSFHPQDAETDLSPLTSLASGSGDTPAEGEDEARAGYASWSCSMQLVIVYDTTFRCHYAPPAPSALGSSQI